MLRKLLLGLAAVLVPAGMVAKAAEIKKSVKPFRKLATCVA